MLKENPAFANDSRGLTKEEYIRISVFNSCLQNPHLIAALSPLGPDGLTSTVIRKSMELADEFIKALSTDQQPKEDQSTGNRLIS